MKRSEEVEVAPRAAEILLDITILRKLQKDSDGIRRK